MFYDDPCSQKLTRMHMSKLNMYTLVWYIYVHSMIEMKMSPQHMEHLLESKSSTIWRHLLNPVGR